MRLDLPSEGGDFHLVYGRNEAGKSSLLRALRSLLFGIHAQTPDDFLHTYSTLRIAAELQKEDGSAQWFHRRKGRRNTLLNEANVAIAERELTAFLGPVDEAYFDAMFGLGSSELRQGANQLLRGEGRLGEALFSASLGGTPVDRVIQDLEREASELFAGRAYKGIRIREAKKQFDAHQDEARKALVRAEDWAEVEQEIAMLDQRHRALRSEAETKQNRMAWLERCQDAMPLLGQLLEHRSQLDSLPELPTLPDSFSETLKEVQSAVITARAQVEHHEKQLALWQEQVKDCPVSPEIRAEERTIDSLHTRIEVFRENQLTLAAKGLEANRGKRRVQAACRDLNIEIPLDQMEALRITEPVFLVARECIDAVTETERLVNTATEDLASLEAKLEQLRNKPRTADPVLAETLEKAILRANPCESVFHEMESRRATHEGVRRELERLHQQLNGAPEEMVSIRTLSPPLPRTIVRFREAFREAEREGKELQKLRLEKQFEVETLKSKVNQLRRRMALPDPESLDVARNHRDRGWQLVLEAWKGGGASEEFVTGKPVEQAYPEAVAEADAIADRLRLHADAVAQVEQFQSQIALTNETLRSLSVQQEQSVDRLAKLRQEWSQAWADSGMTPRTPTEMEEWRTHWETFNRQWDQWATERDRIRQDEQHIEEAGQQLATALDSEDHDFSVLVRHARSTLDSLKQAAGAEREIRVQILETEKQRDRVQADLSSLKEHQGEAAKTWEICRADLSLAQALSPSHALTVLGSRRDLFREYDRWQELARECEELQERIREFEAEVRELSARLGIAASDVEDAERAAWNALLQARQAQTRRESLANQIETTTSQLTDARQHAHQAGETLGTCLTQAGLSHPEEMDGFLASFEARSRHRTKMNDAREALAGLARGDGVDAFTERIEQEDAASLDGERSRLADELKELNEQTDQERAQLQEAEQKRRTMEDARDDAAGHIQLAELAAAQMGRDAERFVRLRLALSMLRSQIDRFREQNQGPLMERSSYWFSTITGGVFSGITTSYDAGDEPVIAGVRSGDPTNPYVAVGGMSEGTCDQLFLALRLAGLEQHLQDHEPMPLILDDLLTMFDDQRAKHALVALHELGQKSQVLLFTHHAHLRDLARTALGDKGLHVHEL